MIRYLVLFTFLVVCSARADEKSDKLTRDGIAEFTAAYQTWDGARFAKAAELFRQSTTNSFANVTNFYWLGTAHFHRMLQLQNSPGSSTNKAAAESALNAAVDALTIAVKLNDKHAESYALLGTLYGMKINHSLVRAAWYGPKVVKNRDLALAAGAKNPRVQYLLGMCEFHTASKPAGWRKALTTLLAAEKSFADETKQTFTPLDPRWGKSSCLTFIGLTYELLGDAAKAKDYFSKALAEHSADHLAKAGLARFTKK